MNNLNFGKTSVDKFKELKEDYSEFIKDKTSTKLALDYAMNAWHLAEWIYKEYNLCVYFPTLKLYQDDVVLQCPALKIMHDLANGNKHYLITKYRPTVKNTTISTGAFSSDFSRDFDISTLVIELNDGSEIYFEDEIEKAMIYWEDYFKTELGVTI